MSTKPKLYLTIGPSGSGKTTWATEYCAKNPGTIYINPDIMRAVLTGNESNQDKNAEVFDVCGKMCEYFMRLGSDILIDATNYNKKNRRCFVGLGRNNYYEIIAIIFKTDVNTCFLRNSLRERRVPNDIIQKHFDLYEAPNLQEFHQIIQSEDLI